MWQGKESRICITNNTPPSSSESDVDSNQEKLPPPPRKRKHEGAFGVNAGLELKARNPNGTESSLKKHNLEKDEDCEERMELIAAAGRVSLSLKDQWAWRTPFMNTSKCPKDVHMAAQVKLDAVLNGAAPSNELRELAIRNNDSWSPSHTKGKLTMGRDSPAEGQQFTQADVMEAKRENHRGKRQAIQEQLQEQQSRSKKKQV